MSIFSKFKKLLPSKVVYPKKYFNFPVVTNFDIRPLYDMKDNLRYMHCEEVYNDDKVIVLCKEDKKVMYKYVIVYDYDHFMKLKLTNEIIVAKNLGREFERGLRIEHLGKIPCVEVIVFAQMTEQTVKHSIKYPTQTKELYQMALVYNEEHHILVQFQYAPTYGIMYSNFKQAIYHDINAMDKENY